VIRVLTSCKLHVKAPAQFQQPAQRATLERRGVCRALQEPRGITADASGSRRPSCVRPSFGSWRRGVAQIVLTQFDLPRLGPRLLLRIRNCPNTVLVKNQGPSDGTRPAIRTAARAPTSSDCQPPMDDPTARSAPSVSRCLTRARVLGPKSPNAPVGKHTRDPRAADKSIPQKRPPLAFFAQSSRTPPWWPHSVRFRPAQKHHA